MAGSGLLALLDDITTLLDDVAVLSKVAAGKTAGISGDDLAVNSQAVIGLDPKRELPVVWSVAKGSFINKCYLIPSALALNFALPALITPILMLGGAYLCYEGVEKILHHKNKKAEDKYHDALTAAALESPEALLEFEQKKIRGAINTDLILSGEIIAITLATVAAAPFITQVIVLCSIGILLTVGIYGLVGAIVKLDDLGLLMARTKGRSRFKKALRICGNGLVHAAPKIMKVLAVAGTAAMLLVGGGLILHGIPGAAHAAETSAKMVSDAGWAHTVIALIAEAAAGLITGLIAVPLVKALAAPFEKGRKMVIRRLKA